MTAAASRPRARVPAATDAGENCTPLQSVPAPANDEPQVPARPALFDTLFDGTVPSTKRNELQAVIADVAKVHGPNILRFASQKARFIHIPTGIFTLDLGLHGGVPKSLITMPYGWESCGKTTVTMRVIAQAQRLYPDKAVVLIDTEGTYDPVWGAVHGIDNDRLVWAQPTSGEQAVDIARAMIKSLEVCMVVLDSLPALMPIKEMQKSAEDEIVALQARLIGRFIRATSQALIDERMRDHYPVLIVINQFRNKIQLMGDPRTLPGGNALKFFVSVRFEIKNKEMMGKDRYDTEVVDHNLHSWQVTKNKVGNGMRNGEFTMIRNPDHPLGAGFIDDAKPVMNFARKFGLLTGAGNSWYLDGYMGLDDATKPMRFGSLQQVADCLYSDLAYFEGLKTRMIGIQRVANGLSGTGWQG